MLGNAKELFAQEEIRMESFRMRGGQLAGFGGVLLGLLGGLLPDSFSDLNGFACTLSRITFGLAAALILVSIVVCLSYVVRPVRVRGLSPTLFVNRYLGTPALLRAKPWQLEMRTLLAYPAILEWQGWLNQRRAGALYVGSIALAGGLFFTALCLGILVAYA